MIDAGERDVDLVDAAWPRSCLSPICTVRYWSSLVTSSGQRYWFHAPRNANTLERRDRRPGERHRDPGHEPPVPVAVERRRVLEVARHLEERLAQQERAEAGGEERHREPLVRVVPTEVVDRREVGDDRDLERHHQRREEHDEQRPLERELEERERVAGEDRGRRPGRR